MCFFFSLWYETRIYIKTNNQHYSTFPVLISNKMYFSESQLGTWVWHIKNIALSRPAGPAAVVVDIKSSHLCRRVWVGVSCFWHAEHRLLSAASRAQTAALPSPKCSPWWTQSYTATHRGPDLQSSTWGWSRCMDGYRVKGVKCTMITSLLVTWSSPGKRKLTTGTGSQHTWV